MESPEIRLLKEIAKSINWQNKRIYEIEKMIQGMARQKSCLDNGNDTDNEGQNADNEDGDINS